MQHSSLCTSSSSKRNNSTCSIGCLASARCIACSVGMCGSLSSRLTSRLPRLRTWLWKPIVTVIIRNKGQQHEKSLIWLVFDSYLDLIWVLFGMICSYLRITLIFFCLSSFVLFGSYFVVFDLIWLYFVLVSSYLDLFGSYLVCFGPYLDLIWPYLDLSLSHLAFIWL